ncbi:MAG: hypothetical protein HC896_12500 [Bacteroidales bacterium]|nr:hypothetical protein [Bacteroidales bacterium]
MRYCKQILFIAFCCLFINTACPNVNTAFYSIEDGLSQSNINCLHIDTRGFLWIGTQDGLNRFDGYGFKIYRNQPLDSNSISNNYIRCIEEDARGNLWIGTNYGLNKLDIETGLFTRIYRSVPDSGSMLSQQVLSLVKLHGNKLLLKTQLSIELFNVDSLFSERVWALPMRTTDL